MYEPKKYPIDAPLHKQPFFYQAGNCHSLATKPTNQWKNSDICGAIFRRQEINWSQLTNGKSDSLFSPRCIPAGHVIFLAHTSCLFSLIAHTFVSSAGMSVTRGISIIFNAVANRKQRVVLTEINIRASKAHKDFISADGCFSLTCM